jgi:IS605 OrfB family transposase
MITQERTIHRLIKELSEEDSLHLQRMCVLYGEVLVDFLAALRTRELRAEILRPREFRNRLYTALGLKDAAFLCHIAELKKQKKNAEAALLEKLRARNTTKELHLQPRHWRLALEEAVTCMEGYWATVCFVAKESLDQCWMPPDLVNGEERHYYNWLLNPKGLQFFCLLDGKIPDPTKEGVLKLGFSARDAAHSTFEKAPVRLRSLALHAASRVNKIRHKRVRFPNLKPPTNRISFDCSSFGLETYEEKKIVKGRERTVKTQIARLTSMIPFKRIRVVLKGFSAFRGNVQLLYVNGRFEFRVFKKQECQELRTEGREIGVDMGYTEVLTDSDGKRYGEGYGKASSAISDKRCRRQRTRNRLGAAVRTMLKSGNAKEIKKAKNIAKHNLGRKKLEENYRRDKEELKSIINRALNEFFAGDVRLVVVEKLAAVMRGRFGKVLNRRLSGWLRGYLKERIQFKAKKFGVQIAEVNPAYSSATCPLCSSSDKSQRRGDEFKCRVCGMTGESDHLAAVNILWRLRDYEITLGMPRRKVFQILQGRSKQFGRLESSSSCSLGQADTPLAAKTVKASALANVMPAKAG